MVHTMTRRSLLASLAACLVVGRDALASAGRSISLGLHNPQAEHTLTAALDDGYWTGAHTYAPKGALYDEIRLKAISGGYVPMITGEGRQNFKREVVADVVFNKMTELPTHMDGAVAVEELGRGHDARVGSDYVDTYFLLDLTLFYTTYIQRMYRRDDGDRIILAYEKLTPAMVSPATWAAYQARADAITAQKATRWMFGSVVPASDIYGMFIVEPGTTYTSRVTYITKVVFGTDAGFIANQGSKMRPVLKSGLTRGFAAAVAICRERS